MKYRALLVLVCAASVISFPGAALGRVGAQATHAGFSHITIALTSDPTSLTPAVAVDMGFFKKYGIPASYTLFSSAGDAVTAAASGAVQLAGTLSELATVGTRAKGGYIQVLCVVDRTKKQVGFVGNSSIKSAQDVVGKTLGATFGQGNQLFALLYLQKHHIPLSQVHFVNVQPADTVAALAHGDIDGFFGFQPWLDRAGQAVPGAHVVNYSGDDGVYTLTLTMVATQNWLSANRAEAVAAMKALRDAANWIHSHPAQAVQEVQSVYHLDPTTAASIFGIQGYTFASPDSIKPLWDAAAYFWNYAKLGENISNPKAFVSAMIYDKAYKQVVKPVIKKKK